MTSKILATLVRIAIDLRLIKNHQLIPQETMEHLKNSLIASEKEVVNLKDKNAATDALFQSSSNTEAYHQERLDEANTRLSQLTDDLTKATSQRKEAVTERDILSQQLSAMNGDLMELQQQVEIANSETLVLQERLDEASAISKQLKEALERWMS